MNSRLIVLIGLLLSAWPAMAQTPHTRARLLLSAASAKPGETITAGIRLEMDPDWHTYWKNPGTGLPTKIVWQFPPGITNGAIEWPTPAKVPAQELTLYLYEHEVILLVPLSIATNAQNGPMDLKAKITWLECQDTQCVPGSANVSAKLEIAAETKPSADAAALDAARAKLPKSGAGLSARAWWNGAPKGDTRPLFIEWKSSETPKELEFYPDKENTADLDGAATMITTDAGKVRLQKTVKKSDTEWPKRISGLLIEKNGNITGAYDVTLTVEDGQVGGSSVTPVNSNESIAASSVGNDVSTGQKSFGEMLIYAFLGGLILNIMPCVLPVIALKILGFVNQAQQDRRKVRAYGLLYALGVLFSFLVMAGLVIGVNAAGRKASWGMQFGSPLFIIILTVLVTLVALNLFGLFEITLSGRVMDKAGGLASREGAAGSFFNGVLATALATPCTAPFLGAALGFAFAQKSSFAIIAFFLTIGLGLAAPYVVLSWEPRWLRFLPKPGAWMEKFKIAMGFPMLATAVWLSNLTTAFYGKRVWWLGVFLVTVAFAAWIFGEFVQRGRAHRGLALGICLALLVGCYAYAIEDRLNWRHPVPPDANAAIVQLEPGGLLWEKWSPQAVAKGRADGRPILVDFTADWCATCNTIVKAALESDSVRAKVKEINALTLLADDTLLPDDITEELSRHGRAGVPMVLVYPRHSDKPPVVLPEALTAGTVVHALEAAAQ